MRRALLIGMFLALPGAIAFAQKLTWVDSTAMAGPVGASVTVTARLDPAMDRARITQVALIFNSADHQGVIATDTVASAPGDPVTVFQATATVPQGAVSGELDVAVVIDGQFLSAGSPTPFQVGDATVSPVKVTLSWVSGSPMQGPVGTPVTATASLNPPVPKAWLQNASLSFTSGDKTVVTADHVSFTSQGDPVTQVTVTGSVPQGAVTGPAYVSATIADLSSSIGVASPAPFQVVTASTAAVPGDVNGDGKVDLRDVILVLDIVVAAIVPSPAQKAAADVNGDGVVNLKDAIALLQAVVGLRPLPAPPTGVTPPPPASDATELRSDLAYPAGTRLKAPWVGVEFTVPKDWTGGITSKDQVFLMNAPSHFGDVGEVLALATAPNAVTVTAGIQLLSQPQNFGNGLVFTPDGTAQANGSVVTQSYHASSTLGPLVGYAQGAVGDTSAVLFVVAGPEKEGPYLKQVLSDLAAAARLTALTPPIDSWRTLLGGGEVVFNGGTYTPQAGGGSISTDSQNTYDFCSDGSYVYTLHGFFNTNAGGGETNDRTLGKWGIAIDLFGPSAVLVPNDGSKASSYRIQSNGGAASLNGTALSHPATTACNGG